jgi:hypothetical protein
LYVTLGSLLLFLTLTKSFPVTCLVDDWFVHEANFLARLCYLYVVMQASKPKYYFAWTLGKFDGVTLHEWGVKWYSLDGLARTTFWITHTKKVQPVMGSIKASVIFYFQHSTLLFQPL